MSIEAGSRWPHEQYCAALPPEIGRFLRAVDGVDPATPVPSCPGWAVADLVRHHGVTHRWIEHIVRHRVEQRVSARELDLAVPGDPADYPAWLAEGTQTLLTTLHATDPDTPLWTWAADRRARFWARRVLHEAVVHRADAELAVGRVPWIEPETAVDGIDEFLTILPHVSWVAERLRELDGAGQTLHLHATDHEGEWMITLGGEGFTWARAHGRATVAVRAAAGDLLLLVYGRLGPPDDRLTVFGDQSLLERWLEHTAF